MTSANDPAGPSDADDPAEDPSVVHAVRLQRVAGILAWVGAAMGLIGAIWGLADDGFTNDSGVAWWWFLFFAAALAVVGVTTNGRIRLIRRSRLAGTRSAEPDEGDPPVASP